MTRTRPLISANVRLPIACSMKVAGLKIVESISMPGRPGFNSASTFSTPRVTSSVLAHGSFSTIIIRPTPSLMTASPMSGQVSHFTTATSFSRGGLLRRFFDATETSARCSGEKTGESKWMTSRWLGVSSMPSMRVFAPCVYLRRPKSRASEVVSMTSSSVTSWARMRPGSTCTCSDLILSPQIGMFATPGTDMRRNLIVQYAIIERSIGSWVFDDSPIFMTRLVDDSGCRMIGMPADCGRLEIPSFTRSCTRCRASMRSVPILNRTVTCERARTDEERITSTFGMPLSASSMGIVIISSTSAAVIPGPSVWISTFGGANSGKTSTGILRSSWLPKTSKAAASANRRNRNLRLEPTAQRNINLPPDPGRAGRDRNNYSRVPRSVRPPLPLRKIFFQP